MKTYLGIRRECDPVVLVEKSRGQRSDLPVRLDLRNHSPTGFEWGYGGSGPAQLALAILADHFGPTGEKRALTIYQDFKARVIATLPYAGFRLSERDVDQAVRAIDKLRAGRV